MDNTNIGELVKQKWADWTLGEWIGGGAYGDVYEAEHVHVEGVSARKYAIKVLSVPRDEKEVQAELGPSYTPEMSKAYYAKVVDDFMKEVELMEQLKSCPNIVHIEDYAKVETELGWKIFIRMEYLTSLSTYFSTNTITSDKFYGLGMDLCQALIACQNKGILHRDIKPDNIFIDEESHFKLGDFGVARMYTATTTGMTVIGTRNYMAPEVFQGQSYDQRADIYSLGLVLYWLGNSRRLPFEDTSKNVLSASDRQAAYQRRMSGEPFPDPAGLSGPICDIIKKACAHNPDDRFQTPSEFYQALYQCRTAGQGSMGQQNTPAENIPQIHEAKPSDNKAQAQKAASWPPRDDEVSIINYPSKLPKEDDISIYTYDSNRAAQRSNAGQNSGKKRSIRKVLPLIIIAGVILYVSIIALFFFLLHKNDEVKKASAAEASENAAGIQDDGKDVFRIVDEASHLVGLNPDYDKDSLTGTLEIPEKVGDVYVAGIADEGFANCASITEVIVPDTVGYIGAGAFKGCTSLESVTLPFVGTSANAENENSVFGAIFGIEAVEAETKWKASGAKLQYINEEPVEILGETWQLSIYTRTDWVGDAQLYHYYYFIPDSLKQVTITEQAEVVPYAFNKCQNIESINYLNKNERHNIGDAAFQECVSLAEFNGHPAGELVIDDGALSVGSYAFKNCKAFTSLNISPYVRSIDAFAFNGMDALQSCVLPFIGMGEDAKIEEAVLGYIFGYEEIVGEEQLSYSSSSDESAKYLVDIEGTTIIGEVQQATTKEQKEFYTEAYYHYYYYFIPETLTSVTITKQASVPAYAFHNCTMLQTITVPSDQEIGENAFKNCPAAVTYTEAAN